MTGQPEKMEQRPYALDRLMEYQKKIPLLAQSLVVQRARIEKYRHADLSAARDSYLELQRVCKALLEILSEIQLVLQELEAYPLSTAAGKLRNGLSGFDLMGTGYKPVYEALCHFASSLPTGKKTNATVIGRLMNNIKMGYYPTDLGNIQQLLRGIMFPEGITSNLLDPCCGCGKALRQLAQGNNCYTYGVELDESRAEEAQTRLHHVGFGSFFYFRFCFCFHLCFF